MFLLSKVFQLRDKANPNAEKPFIEHLEDFRILVTRSVVTLLIGMILCFSYRDQMMEILRKPISDVWEMHSENKLPASGKMTADQWEQAKFAAEALSQLPQQYAENYLRQLSQLEQSHAKVAASYRAAITLPTEKQKPFCDSITDLSADEKSLLDEILVSKPDAVAGSKDRFKFMSSLNPTESFMLSMKLAFFAGTVISFPLLLMYLLKFIMPGLHQNEKKAILPALAIGFGLFLGGVFFSYLLVLPKVLEFFYSYGESMGIANEWRIGYYLSFATQFTLIFGLCFELPVVVWVLVKIGLLDYELMSRTRSYAMVAIVVIAAIITPTPDAFTLALLALPMAALYEISIWLAWFDARRAKKQEEQEERERMARLLDRTPNDASLEQENSDLQATEEGEEADYGDAPKP